MKMFQQNLLAAPGNNTVKVGLRNMIGGILKAPQQQRQIRRHASYKDLDPHQTNLFNYLVEHRDDLASRSDKIVAEEAVAAIPSLANVKIFTLKSWVNRFRGGELSAVSAKKGAKELLTQEEVIFAIVSQSSVSTFLNSALVVSLQSPEQLFKPIVPKSSPPQNLQKV
jgi:hypothetical protein